MKKKIICAFLIAAAVLSAASCQNSGSKPTDTKPADEKPAVSQDAPAPADEAKSVSAADVTKAVLDEIPINSAFEKTKDTLNDYFDKLDTDALTDFSFYLCASGAYPDEIAFFTFASDADAEKAVPAVKARLEEQIDLYETYTPKEFYKLENAVIAQSGKYVYYLVTSDNEKAESIVKGLIG